MPHTIVDYTQHRKGSTVNGLRVDYCPKCKRKGLVRPGDGCTEHVHTIEMVKVLGCSLAKDKDVCREDWG